MGEEPVGAEVRYFVLPDTLSPYLLARVRWPDVAQVITAGRPYWQEDPGVFDLPYDPSSAPVTPGEAASIATAWGAHISAGADSAFSLIRRMPADWSDLVPAEKRALSLEHVTGRGALEHRKSRRVSLWARRSSSRRSEVGTAAEESRYLVAGDNHHLAATDERRRHARVRVYGRVQFSSGDKTLSANLVNVSQGGVHLVVPDSRSLLGFGRELEPPLLLEDDVSKSRIRLDVASSVTWNEDVGTGARLGVVFAELDSEQVERIRAFVATVGAEPSS